MLSFFAHSTLLVWGLTCAIQDIRTKKISNLLTLGLFAMACGSVFITGQTLIQASASQALMGLVYAIALSLPGYIMGKMGAADVKMLCALGIASNSHYVLICVMGAAVALIIWSVSKPLWHKLPLSVHKAIPLMDPTQGHPLPYAPFLLLGMLLASVLS